MVTPLRFVVVAPAVAAAASAARTAIVQMSLPDFGIVSLLFSGSARPYGRRTARWATGLLRAGDEVVKPPETRAGMRCTVFTNGDRRSPRPGRGRAPGRGPAGRLGDPRRRPRPTGARCRARRRGDRLRRRDRPPLRRHRGVDPLPARVAV